MELFAENVVQNYGEIFYENHTVAGIAKPVIILIVHPKCLVFEKDTIEISAFSTLIERLWYSKNEG